MRMNYCSKIFGTHLHYCGIESEMVNLLEGTISPEIFVKHYWKIEKWALSDLSILKLRLKCEFNASKSDLLDKEARLLLSQ